MSARYKVSFDFHDEDGNANSQDFRDLLMEKFEQAVLEGRMTHVSVRLDYEAMDTDQPPTVEAEANTIVFWDEIQRGRAAPSIEDQIAELKAAGWSSASSGVWKSPAGALYRGPHGAWKVMRAWREGHSL